MSGQWRAFYYYYYFSAAYYYAAVTGRCLATGRNNRA